MMDVVQVVPLESFEGLGTNIKLTKGVPTMAIAAVNQPDWERQGKMFVFEADVTDLDSDRCMLLERGDYIAPNPCPRCRKHVPVEFGKEIICDDCVVDLKL